MSKTYKTAAAAAIAVSAATLLVMAEAASAAPLSTTACRTTTAPTIAVLPARRSVRRRLPAGWPSAIAIVLARKVKLFTGSQTVSRTVPVQSFALAGSIIGAVLLSRASAKAPLQWVGKTEAI